jgi:hypothetical protein
MVGRMVSNMNSDVAARSLFEGVNMTNIQNSFVNSLTIASKFNSQILRNEKCFLTKMLQLCINSIYSIKHV